MGIQTFQDSTSKLLQRRHTAEQAIRAFQNCRTAGFRNLSIDLMYGLPGETLASWKEDFKQALAFASRTYFRLLLVMKKEPLLLLNFVNRLRLEEADERSRRSLMKHTD